MSHGRSQRRKARLGQNFLVNQGVVERLVGALPDLRDRAVVEIGPGRGILTRTLLREGARVLALELDPELAEPLRVELADQGCDVLQADATRVTWDEILARAAGTGPVLLAANLPYESGTHMLLQWLEASARDERLGPAAVMLQREVAERVTGRPDTRDYGSLAVLAQSTHRVQSVMNVGPGSFRPQPRVMSRVIALERRPDPLFAPDERAAVSAFLHAAFRHRRKQMASDLAGSFGRTREAWQAALATLGRPPDARAEALSPAELVALARGVTFERGA